MEQTLHYISLPWKCYKWTRTFFSLRVIYQNEFRSFLPNQQRSTIWDLRLLPITCQCLRTLYKKSVHKHRWYTQELFMLSYTSKDQDTRKEMRLHLQFSNRFSALRNTFCVLILANPTFSASRHKAAQYFTTFQTATLASVCYTLITRKMTSTTNPEVYFLLPRLSISSHLISSLIFFSLVYHA